MKYMAKVVEKLSIFKMTRASYSYYQKQIHTDRDEPLIAEARGEAKSLSGEHRPKHRRLYSYWFITARFEEQINKKPPNR